MELTENATIQLDAHIVSSYQCELLVKQPNKTNVNQGEFNNTGRIRILEFIKQVVGIRPFHNYNTGSNQSIFTLVHKTGVYPSTGSWRVHEMWQSYCTYCVFFFCKSKGCRIHQQRKSPNKDFGWIQYSKHLWVPRVQSHRGIFNSSSLQHCLVRKRTEKVKRKWKEKLEGKH